MTCEALCITIEANDILGWPFDFWNAVDKRRIRKKLGRMNGIFAQVHVICAIEANIDLQKWYRLQDGSFAPINVDISPIVEDIGGFGVPTKDPLLPVVSSLRINGTTNYIEGEDKPLKSLLFCNTVMDRQPTLHTSFFHTNHYPTCIVK